MIGDIETDGRRGRMAPIEHPRLVDSALEAVRTAILMGRLAPGERLLEVPLAQELGISRSSLREALHLLEKDGIIYSVPRRGKFVQTLDLQAIDELYSLRKILEPFAAGLATERAAAEGIQALEQALQRMREAADAGDVRLLTRRDIAFHQTLIELARHRLLRRAWMENVSGKLHILLNATEPTHWPLHDVLDRHRRLVDGITSGDQSQAKDLLREHIDDAWARARATDRASEDI
jgi:DNA-binding GntR family transcriptional regulator